MKRGMYGYRDRREPGIVLQGVKKELNAIKRALVEIESYNFYRGYMSEDVKKVVKLKFFYKNSVIPMTQLEVSLVVYPTDRSLLTYYKKISSSKGVTDDNGIITLDYISPLASQIKEYVISYKQKNMGDGKLEYPPVNWKKFEDTGKTHEVKTTIPIKQELALRIEVPPIYKECFTNYWGAELYNQNQELINTTKITSEKLIIFDLDNYVFPTDEYYLSVDNYHEWETKNKYGLPIIIEKTCKTNLKEFTKNEIFKIIENYNKNKNITPINLQIVSVTRNTRFAQGIEGYE